MQIHDQLLFEHSDIVQYSVCLSVCLCVCVQARMCVCVCMRACVCVCVVCKLIREVHF